MDAGGNIIEWFGAASDVTARKRAELELGEGEPAAWARRTCAWSRLIAAKSEFLAVLSHELRKPARTDSAAASDVLDHTPPTSGADPEAPGRTR